MIRQHVINRAHLHVTRTHIDFLNYTNVSSARLTVNHNKYRTQEEFKEPVWHNSKNKKKTKNTCI